MKVISCLILLIASSFAADEVNQYLSKTPAQYICIRSALETTTTVTLTAIARIIIPAGKRPLLKLPSKAKKTSSEDDIGDASTISITNPGEDNKFYELSYEESFTVNPGAKEECIAKDPFLFRSISHEGYLNLQHAESNIAIEVELSSIKKPLLPLIITPFDISTLRDKHRDILSYTKQFRDELTLKFAESSEAYFKHHQQMYDQFIGKLKELQADDPLKIPQTVHTIWVTNPDIARMPRNETFDLLVQTMRNLSPSQGWKYVLWVHNFSDLPLLQESPTQNPDFDRQIQMRSIAETFADSRWYRYYKLAMDECNYGKASDIARLIILDAEGGVYRDTDYAFLMDVKELHQVCDFYAGLENSDAIAACNAVMAARPHHPVITRALEHIAEGYDHPSEELFKDRVIGTLFHTGPFMLSRSFFEGASKGAGEDGAIDVLMPPQVFYGTSFVSKDGRAYSRQVWHQASLGYHQHFKEWC